VQGLNGVAKAVAVSSRAKAESFAKYLKAMFSPPECGRLSNPTKPLYMKSLNESRENGCHN
jgi:hypothetical protein